MANKAGLSDLTLRFLKQMQELNLTGYQLKKNGVIGNEATLTKIKQGLQQPSRKTLDKFCEVYNINKVWLLTGEGDMLKSGDEATDKPRINYSQGVPYYNVDFIGGFDIVENDQTVNPEYLIDFKPYAKATCWCNISGHSMEPEINNGDIIALRRIDDFSFLPMGEIYAIVTKNDMRTVKRIGPSANPDNYTLIPTNKSPEYGIQELPKNMILAVFEVMGCMKRF